MLRRKLLLNYRTQSREGFNCGFKSSRSSLAFDDPSHFCINLNNQKMIVKVFMSRQDGRHSILFL